MKKDKHAVHPLDATHVYHWSHGRCDLLKRTEKGEWRRYEGIRYWVAIPQLLSEYFERAFYG